MMLLVAISTNHYNPGLDHIRLISPDRDRRIAERRPESLGLAYLAKADLWRARLALKTLRRDQREAIAEAAES